MIKIGVIGAGSISKIHLDSYKNNSGCEVLAIADLNIDLANQRAREYGIAKVFTDYKELLADEEIDAVSIVTPTFTHTNIVIDALKSGKDVLCEKPPALTADEVKECAKVSKETGKLLMYAFVVRFYSQVQYLKNYIESGKMGEFIYAEAARLSRCVEFNGWLCDKEKCGGFLFDSGIHELDLALYLMGYPKPKTVLGFTSDVNSELPERLKSKALKYTAMDTQKYERTIDSFTNANIVFDNGICLNVKSSSALNIVNENIYLDICGKNAGFHFERTNPEKKLELLEFSEDGYFNKLIPDICDNNIYDAEINHFIDCIVNKTECICKHEEAIMLIEILNAIYESAKTGKAVEF